jgi:hypothetical protein
VVGDGMLNTRMRGISWDREPWDDGKLPSMTVWPVLESRRICGFGHKIRFPFGKKILEQGVGLK